MASSGSFNTASFEGRYLKFSWSEKSQSVANNTTTISWTLKGAGTGESGWYYAGNFKVVIDGKTVYSTASDDRIKLYNGTEVAKGEVTLTHKDDGTRSFSASAQAGIYTYAVNCKGSGSFTLDAIARASQPSCVTWPEHTQDVGEFGDTISIHMNRNSDAFTHTVRYAYGSLTGTIATGVTTGTTWTIPLSFMDLIPANTSGSGTIYVDTYNGSTLVGTKSCGFTATVPASVKPTCSLALEDVSGADYIYGSPVKGLSRIKVTVTAKEAYNSPIAGYSITANGVTYSAAAATTDVLRTAGTSKVTVTVTDKRGRSGSASYDMTVQDYTAPVVSALTVHRCDEDGATNDRGEYVKVTFSAAVSSMSSKNAASYKLQYKKSSDSSYTAISLTALNNKYAVEDYTYIFAADGSSAYDIIVTATDKHGAAARSTSASTALTLINYHEAGDAIRFGGVAEEENTFQNDLEFCQRGNSYAFQPGSFDGEKGYTCVAEITLNQLNVNAPIVFTLNRRGATSPMKVYIRFASSSTSTDPDLASIVYEGDNYGAFMIRTAESVWRLYVDNTGGWSNLCLQEWFTTDNQMARISVTFPNEQVAGTEPAVLNALSVDSAYYRATPVISRSILDAFYPVGYILLLYSHADPNTMYPGTTWLRITNAFLWATTAGGTIGQTGGESEVTLTAGQIPAHTHTYQTPVWLVAEGNDGGFDGNQILGEESTATSRYTRTSGSAGGGAAHNNMPPYIQVSVWRRTA